MAELAERIDSREFSEWLAFYALEPWGEPPTDLRHGILASLIANVNRDETKQRKPFKPQDFMLAPTPTIPRDGEAVTGDGESGGWRETKRRFMALVRKTPTPVIDRPPREGAGEGR